MSTTTSSTAVSSPFATWVESVGEALRQTPGTLRLVQALVIFAALLYAALSLSFYSYLDKASRAIGRDSEPSIVAAQNIRGLLGDAHANVATAFLLREPQNGDHWADYRGDMEEVHDALLGAAQNITYGESERGPIASVMKNVSLYERLIGQAVAQGDAESLMEADQLMREKIQPAAAALDQANFSPLSRTWDDFKAHASTEIVIVLVGSLTLLGLLVFAQVYHFRKTRRILNFGLLFATVVFAVSTAILAFTCVHIRNDMRVAKEDAFDSIHALWQARAEAYAASAQASFYLLDGNHGTDGAQPLTVAQQGQRELLKSFYSLDIDAKHIPNRAQRLAEFRQDERKLLDASPEQVANALNNKLRLKGLLGDELANITFDGEGEAALQAVTYWNAYAQVYQDLLKLDVKAAAADPDKALELSQAVARADLAFGAFDNSLEKTIDINENAFDNSIDKVVANIGYLPWLFAITAVLVIVSTVAGFRPRLNKYRF